MAGLFWWNFWCAVAAAGLVSAIVVSVLFRRVRKYVALVLAAGLLAVGIGALFSVVRAAFSDRSEGLPPGAVIAALDAPAGAFPEGVDTDALVPAGFDRATAHKMGEDGAQSYWAGLDQAGDICLVTIFDARPTIVAACSTPHDVESNGLELSAWGGDRQPDRSPTVVILLPDSVSAQPIARSSDRALTPAIHPWKKHGSNLVVARQSEVPKDVTYEFNRKRGHRGPAISFHG